MIRVLHSVSNMDRAGIETMLMNYYRHMDRDKIQFDFLANKSKKGAYDEEIKNMGGRVYVTPGFNPIKSIEYRNFMMKLFREHPEYKIVHAHNGALGYWPLKYAEKSGIPVRIAHSHNTRINFDLKWIIKSYCKKRLKKVANLYWGCGKEAVEFYFREKAEQEGYKIINNAIEVERFLFNEEKRNEIRESYHLEDKIVIGHVGRFMLQKNHKFLIKIFKAIHDKNENTVLLLIGEGELEQEVRNQVEELKLQDSIIFTGSIPNVNEMYQAMDAFILPSLYEGLPVVGIEAQAAGLPCYFSNTVTDETAITDLVKFISLEDSTDIWADIMLADITKHENRKNMYGEITEAGYNIEIEAKKLQDMYLNMV